MNVLGFYNVQLYTHVKQYHYNHQVSAFDTIIMIENIAINRNIAQP